MNVTGTSLYLYAVILLVASGCSKISPQIGFGLLKSSDDSLTIESSLETINSTSANSTVQLKGLCEVNTNLNLIGPNQMTFKCENLSYQKDLPASLFSEGENMISIEALDNSLNRIASKTIKILKDTTVPNLNISGPTSVPETDTQISLSGACSENGLAVTIKESILSTSADVLCANGSWSYSAAVPTGSAEPALNYTAQHSDAAGNMTSTTSITVTRVFAPAFTIRGVRNLNSETPGNLLRRNNGNLIVSWTGSATAASFDVYIERNYLSTPTNICSQTGLTGTEHTFILTGGCRPNPGESLRVRTVGWNAARTMSTTVVYPFTVKPPPDLLADAKIIYVNSDPDSAFGTVSVSYDDLVSDAYSSGPFTMTLSDTDELTGLVVADNQVSGQSLNITPTTSTSGIFSIKVKIADENSLESESIELRIAIVYPYSWTGSASNVFSNRLNWCGIAGLKSGCPGASNPPTSANRVFLDNLCEKPTPASASIRCSPALTSNYAVQSMFIKDGSFSQAGYEFSVGSLNDSKSYFKMTSGLFNDGSTDGTLNIFKSFQIEGGIFNAPRNSNVNLNTNMATAGSDVFRVVNSTYYAHNNSTLNLLDPTGQAATQNISVPGGFNLYNFTINSNGGYWGIKSTSLNIVGDLTLSGTKDSGNVYPMVNANLPGAKINLFGDLNCTGAFGGGNLPIYIVGAAVKYKTTHEGCKLPQIKVANIGVAMSESAASTEDTTLNSLSVTAGSFSAPPAFRKLIFKSSGLDDDTVVADINNAGFYHNFGRVVFETASSGLNYRISLPVMSEVLFSNPANLTSFYDIKNNFTGSSFSLIGSNNIPLRGDGRSLTFSQLTFNTGLVIDGDRLNKLVQHSSGASRVNVNTSNPINIPQLEMKNAYGFTGTSNILDFSGTVFILSTSNVEITSSQDLKYFSKTGPATFYGSGIFVGGY